MDLPSPSNGDAPSLADLILAWPELLFDAPERLTQAAEEGLTATLG